jgi:hypothetical protein
LKSKLIKNAEELLSQVEIKNLLPGSQHENEIHMTARKLVLPLWQELYRPGSAEPDPQDELTAAKIFWLGQRDPLFDTRHGKVFDFSMTTSDFWGSSARFRESESPLFSQLKEFVESHQRVRIAFYKQQVDERSFAISLLKRDVFKTLQTQQEWEGWRESWKKSSWEQESRIKNEAIKSVVWLDQKNDRAVAFGTKDGFFEITQPYQARYDFSGVWGDIDNTVEERQSHGHEEGNTPCVEGSWEFLTYKTICEFLKKDGNNGNEAY